MFTLSLVHILFGTIAFLAGVGAFAAAKGSTWHRRFGNIFTVTMTATALAGVWLAAIALQAITALAGVLAAYLVLTGWTSLRKEGALSQVLQALATITVLLVSVGTLAAGFLALDHPSGEYQNFAAGDYFYLAGIAILAAGGRSLLVRLRGLRGQTPHRSTSLAHEYRNAFRNRFHIHRPRDGRISCGATREWTVGSAGTVYSCVTRLLASEKPLFAHRFCCRRLGCLGLNCFRQLNKDSPTAIIKGHQEILQYVIAEQTLGLLQATGIGP